jgi:hypothetical protein
MAATTFSQPNMTTFILMWMTFPSNDEPIRHNYSLTGRISNNEGDEVIYPYSPLHTASEDDISSVIQGVFNTATQTIPPRFVSTDDHRSGRSLPWRRPRKSITLLNVNVSRFNVMDGLFDYVVGTMDSVIELFAMTPVSTKVVHQVSIPILLIHSTIAYLSGFVTSIQQHAIFIDLSGAPFPSNISAIIDAEQSSLGLVFDWALPLHVLFVWIFPILFTISGLSFTAALQFQRTPNEASALEGLIALFLMDFIVPLAVIFCTLFHFLWNFRAPDTFALVASIWFACFCGAAMIRWVIYPRIGCE